MGKWTSRQGAGCTVHEYHVNGVIKGVMVQKGTGYTPKIGGEILPGRWPGKVGAAKKALVNHQETKMRTISQLEAAEMKAELEYYRAKEAREDAQAKPPKRLRRTAQYQAVAKKMHPRVVKAAKFAVRDETDGGAVPYPMFIDLVNAKLGEWGYEANYEGRNTRY